MASAASRSPFATRGRDTDDLAAYDEQCAICKFVARKTPTRPKGQGVEAASSGALLIDFLASVHSIEKQNPHRMMSPVGVSKAARRPGTTEYDLIKPFLAASVRCVTLAGGGGTKNHGHLDVSGSATRS
jgi:hypothetical protein